MRIHRTVCWLIPLLFVVVVSQSWANDAASRRFQQLLIQETEEAVDRSSGLSARPESGYAKWMSGLIKYDRDWMPVDDAIVVPNRQARIATYEIQRAEYGSSISPEEHLKIANWCRRNGYQDQERAHLFAVMASDRSLATEPLLKRYGFRQSGGDWIAPERLAQFQCAQKTIEESLRSWRRTMESVAKRIDGPRKDRAFAELANIKDPAAVPAIELVLGQYSLGGTRAAIRTLAGIDSYESSLALTRFACFHPGESIREEAISALKDRNPEDFVPAIIAMMSTPAEVYSAFKGPAFVDLQQHLLGAGFIGGIVVRRETDNEIQVLRQLIEFEARITQTLITGARIPNKFNLSAPSASDIGRDTVRKIHSELQDVSRWNDETRRMNARFGKVFCAATRTEFTDDPRQMWKSWYASVDLEQPDEKAVVEVEERESSEFAATLVIRSSCFAAGTSVLTETGSQPIEKIQVGDRVLAKDIETGELRFQPVLKTTVRRPKQLVRLMFGEEVIDSTPKHRFWKSGTGWVAATDLKPQDLIHTATGSAELTAVESGPVESTYNLVVEKFHTYFVGDNRLLAQDVVLPVPTNMVIPGLSRFQKSRLEAARKN